ncbi:MAG TPA: Arm DNA-binding domain-containing protein [Myxococcota bacterium]|nr:Arm DNA-binding domain-containing protein [Myxococcota bacterium]
MWDAGLPGFGVRVGKRKRTWIAQYRARGRTRRMALGNAARISLAEARAKTANVLARVERREDPAAKRQQIDEVRRFEGPRPPSQSGPVPRRSRGWISPCAQPKSMGRPTCRFSADDVRTNCGCSRWGGPCRSIRSDCARSSAGCGS